MAQRLLPQLLVELEERIVCLLPPNEIAGNLRLVNKATAAFYTPPLYRTMRLSEPVPHHAFTWQWGPNSRAWRPLTLRRRETVLSLTAAGGDLTNLELAVQCAGCNLLVAVLEAAAAAGHLHICEWLRAQGCPWGYALRKAAQAGRREVCEWLLAQGCPHGVAAALGAAHGGHVDLMDWLLLLSPVGLDGSRGFGRGHLACGAATGCDLATHGWQAAEAARAEVEGEPFPEAAGGGAGEVFTDFGEPLGFQVIRKPHVLAAAVASRTPDWQAKVEWLEAQGCPKTSYAAAQAVGLPDAVDRLRWLRNRDYPFCQEVVGEAAGKGNVAALQYLLGEAGVRVVSLGYAGAAAAGGGHLAALQALHAHGQHPDAGRVGTRDDVLCAACGSGNLAVVAWWVEVQGVDLAVESEQDTYLQTAAACSGNVELLAWLLERGCSFEDGAAFICAAEAGSVEALEWLVEHGCPIPVDGRPYTMAAQNGDLSTLRCLRRLGCPWGCAAIFTVCVTGFGIAAAPLAALRWMVDEGCPVNWGEVLRATQR